MEKHYSTAARDVFNGSPVVFAVDAEGVFTLSEGPGLEVLGLKAGKMVGRCAFEAYAGEPSVSENLSRALSGESFASVVEVAGASFECLYNPLRDAAGAVVGVVGFAVETSGRGRGVEDALVESEERYRELAENVQEGVGLLGPGEDALVEYCNRAYAEVLGLLPDELVGRSFLGFLDEEQKEEMLRHRSLRREGVGSSYEVRATAADGKKKHLSCGGYPIFDRDGSYKGAVHTIVDVTERRRVGAALKVSEERYRLAFERAPVSMAHVAPDGRFIVANDRFCDLSGYGRKDLLGMKWQDISPQEDLEAGLDRARRMFGGEMHSYSAERRYIRKDGTRVWIELSVSLVRKPSGEPDYIICVADEITERKLEELVPDPLTPREKDVLRLMSAGRSNERVAEELRQSLGTVKFDVRCVLRKLGVQRRSEAAARAVEIGLISPPPS